MKKLLVIVLVLTLALSMSVNVLATPNEEESDASIEFTAFDGDEGVFCPTDPPPTGCNDLDDDIAEFASMDLHFHSHPINLIYAVYYSYEPGSAHANAPASVAARIDTAGMVVFAPGDWEVHVEMSDDPTDIGVHWTIDDNGTDVATMIGYELYLRRHVASLPANYTPDLYEPITATLTVASAWTSVVGAAAEVASGTAGIFATELEGRLHVPAGSALIEGDAQAIMDWTYHQV